jgi:hypothetical protein
VWQLYAQCIDRGSQSKLSNGLEAEREGKHSILCVQFSCELPSLEGGVVPGIYAQRWRKGVGMPQTRISRAVFIPTDGMSI